jgi:Tfp pilus assembly protein PilX
VRAIRRTIEVGIGSAAATLEPSRPDPLVRVIQSTGFGAESQRVEMRTTRPPLWPLLAGVQGRLRNERGVALVLALIVVSALTISTAGLTLAITSNEKAFGRDHQDVRALNAAEAGLNAAMSTLNSSAAGTTALPNASGSIDQGTWSYTATRTQSDPTGHPNDYTWTVTSTGTSPDGRVQRIVRSQYQQSITIGTQTQTQTIPASPVYGYGFFIGDPSSDCTAGSGGNTISGSGGIRVPVYIAGSLCMDGGSFIAEPTGSTGTLTVYVGRKFWVQGSASPVGTSAARIASATIVGGCLATGSKVSVSCSQQGSPNNCPGGGCGSGIWSNAYSSTQNAVPKPVIDPTKYSDPKVLSGGSATTCGAGSTFPNDSQTAPGTPWSAAAFKSRVIDNDSIRNTSLGTVDFLQLKNNWNSFMNSFDCRSYDPSGTLIGRFRWTFPSSCGADPAAGTADLTISGTVFIDGNLSFSGCDKAVYEGRGTIYANGTINFTNGAKVCAKPISGASCLGNYDPAQNLLELVAVNASNQPIGFDLSNDGKFEGVAWTNKGFNSGNSAWIAGPVIADTATVSGAATVMKNIVPPDGAPGAQQIVTTTTTGPNTVDWSPVPGSWQQLR